MSHDCRIVLNYNITNCPSTTITNRLSVKINSPQNIAQVRETVVNIMYI